MGATLQLLKVKKAYKEAIFSLDQYQLDPAERRDLNRRKMRLLGRFLCVECGAENPVVFTCRDFVCRACLPGEKDGQHS